MAGQVLIDDDGAADTGAGEGPVGRVVGAFEGPSILTLKPRT